MTFTKVHFKTHNISTGTSDYRVCEVDGEITHDEAVEMVKEEFGAWVVSPVMITYHKKGFDILDYIGGNDVA